jgi:hypothetical protein
MIQYSLIDPKAKPPKRAFEGELGISLYQREDLHVLPGEKVIWDSGVRFRFPPETCGLVFLRAPITSQHQLHLFDYIVGVFRMQRELIDFTLLLCLYRTAVLQHGQGVVSQRQSRLHPSGEGRMLVSIAPCQGPRRRITTRG